MNITTKIKLGGVTNLSDARFAAAVGVSYVGFNFDPSSPSYIPPIKAKDIIDWVNAVFIVAEFGNQSLSEINDICELLKIDIVEVENSLTPAELATLNIPIIKKVDLDKHNQDSLSAIIDQYKSGIDGMHVYASSNSFNASLVKLINSQTNLIWGLPINKHNLDQTLNEFNPFAINLLGGEEEKPGYKDFDELAEIIDMIIPQV